MRCDPALFAVLCLSGFAACSGQTGGDGPAVDCSAGPAQPLADTQTSPVGLSPADVLAFAAGPQQLELARSNGGTPLMASLELRTEPGSALFYPSRPTTDTGRIRFECHGHVIQDVEVELTLELPDGARRLSAAGVLSASSGSLARLSAELAPDDVDALRDFELHPGERAARLQLQALLTPAGSSGKLVALLVGPVMVVPQPPPRGNDPPAQNVHGSSRSVDVAHWPANASCKAGELPVSVDGELFGISAAQVLRPFATELPLKWSDGIAMRTQLTLSPVVTGGVCLHLDNVGLDKPLRYYTITDDPPTFSQPLELSIATADGRFSARLTSQLVYEANPDGGIARAWLVESAKMAPGDPGGWSGIAPGDLATQRMWRLELVRGPDDAVSGWLTLQVVRDVPCYHPSSGAPPACLPPVAGTASGQYFPLLDGTVE